MFLKLTNEGPILPESFVSLLSEKCLFSAKVNEKVYVYNFEDDAFDLDRKEEVVNVQKPEGFELCSATLCLDLQDLPADTKSFLLSL
jgi:hypothetical protein